LAFLRTPEKCAALATPIRCTALKARGEGEEGSFGSSAVCLARARVGRPSGPDAVFVRSARDLARLTLIIPALGDLVRRQKKKEKKRVGKHESGLLAAVQNYRSRAILIDETTEGKKLGGEEGSNASPIGAPSPSSPVLESTLHLVTEKEGTPSRRRCRRRAPLVPHRLLQHNFGVIIAGGRQELLEKEEEKKKRECGTAPWAIFQYLVRRLRARTPTRW